MNFDQAYSIYQQIEGSKLTQLKNEFYRAAIRYARIRTDWALADQEERIAMDRMRTIAHNAFIDSCNILSRNMKTAGEDYHWRERLGTNRGEIGDFACYLHCILGLSAR